MRSYFALLFLVATLPVVAQRKNAPAVKWNDFDSAFARVLRNWQGPGFAVAVVRKDQVIYARGFGYRDLEKKIPVSPATLFAIGSCTKAFTAVLVGRLSEQQHMELDKPVRSYLPELKFYNEDMNQHVTLRDMMSHRTGLPRHDFSWYIFQTSRDSLLARIEFLEPSAAPREKWQYNNFMFMAQGVLVEKKTGRSWEDNVRDSLFSPLGMIRSNTSIAAMEKDSNASLGYNLNDSGKVWSAEKTDYYTIGAMGPAGSINSSVLDMSAWLRTWIHRGKFNGRQIVPAAFAGEAMSSQMIIGGALPDSAHPDIYFSTYGLGWMMGSYKGHYRVEHGGNIDGFSASTCFFPGDSIGIVVLSNQSNSQIPAIVRNLIADKLLGTPYTDWNSELYNRARKGQEEAKSAAKNKVAETTAAKSTHVLKDYDGLYRSAGYGTLDVKPRHDSLYATAGTYTWFFKPAGYEWYEIYILDKKGRIDTSNHYLKMEFRTGADGSLTALEGPLEGSVKPIVFTRVPRAVAMSADSLAAYSGTYAIGQVELTVAVKNNSLRLNVPGQPEYELVAIEKDKFSLKGVTGFTVLFERDAKNKVTGLQSIQPNGTFKALKK